MGKSKGKGGKSGKGQHSVSFAQAWRDVMLKAMTTGQLVPITISIVLMIAAWRMPSEELGILAHRIIDGLADHSLIGYGLCVIVILAWKLVVLEQKKLCINRREHKCHWDQATINP